MMTIGLQTMSSICWLVDSNNKRIQWGNWSCYSKIILHVAMEVAKSIAFGVRINALLSKGCISRFSEPWRTGRECNSVP